MTLRRRVHLTRLMLLAGVGAKALLSGAAVTSLVIAAWAGLDALSGLPRGLRGGAVPSALLVGATTLGWTVWRGRFARLEPAVALWIEERLPQLRYALVTALDPGAGSARAALEHQALGVSWRRQTVGAIGRAVAFPLLVLGSAVVGLSLLPGGALARVARPSPGDALWRAAPGGRAGRLAPIVVTVTPPAYTGLSRLVLEDPDAVDAPVGSALAIEGRGGASVTARLGDTTVSATVAGDRWRVLTAMPPAPAPLRLSSSDGERLLLLEPRPDSAPVVSLTSPARDSVLRSGTGSITLQAAARDDYGLASGWFELIVSAGEGELFEFRTGVLGRVEGGAERSLGLGAQLRLDSLALTPGSVVHIRAVARDGNAVQGPALGASETRSFRVARRGEYDSLFIEAMAPFQGDTSALSQRMLIMLAEALQRRRPRLARDTVVAESRRIAADQARLRRRVADIVFIRLGGEEEGEHAHQDERDGPLTPEELLRAAEAATQVRGEVLDFSADESPVVATSRPLLEAYHAMWDATRELEVGEPGRALPHMRAALSAIQRARAAERVYLRGRVPATVVDIARARLAGDLEGAAAGGRAPRTPARRARAALAARFASTVRMLGADPLAATDSLLLLRLDALGVLPALASALGEAAAALRSGGEASAALAAARRAVLEPPTAGPLPRWGGAW
jgi:hypothetical protein